MSFNTNMIWQVCSFEQAVELHKLGTHQDTVYWFSPMGILYLNKETSYKEIGNCAAYTLAELATMLGYTFCPTNVKDAADKLIEEIKVGSSTVKECNDRLLEAQTL